MTPETTKHRFTAEKLQQADDGSEGFCLACRAPRGGCEPDAQAYECEECGEYAVYGPHPSLTLDIEQGFVTGLWVAGRRPDLIIRDFDLGASAPDASLDVFGAPFVSINWHLPPWRLGLALAPAHLFPF